MNRYEYDINLDDDSVAARIVRLVGYDKRVLELGCSSGHMSREFQRRGCTVVGVEYDAAAMEGARAYCAAVYPLDLNDPAWGDAVRPHGPFDVIVAADVLEHLRDPQACLARMRTLLAANGTVVISTPNIAHGGVIAGLLRGEFNYRETGLLDRTHIHFFTEQSLRTALEAEGYVLVHASPVNADQYHPEFSAQWAQLPEAWQRALKETPSAQAFQVVMAATCPNTDEPLVAIRQETQRQLDASRQQRDELSRQLSQRQTELNDARAQLEATSNQLAALKASLTAEVATLTQQRDEQLQARTQLQRHSEAQAEALVRLDAALVGVRNSTSWKITAPLRLAGKAARGMVYLLRQSTVLPKRVARGTYRLLPAVWREAIKHALFSELPWVFRRTYAYQSWLACQSSPVPTLPGGLATTAAEQPRWSQHEPLLYSEPNLTTAMQLVAFYRSLPDFAAERESNLGASPSEWALVSKAAPQFEGHYQPHLPGELGFYDSASPEVMARQVTLAKLAGLGGFCFHYSSSAQHTSGPLALFVGLPALDFPFCICWDDAAPSVSESDAALGLIADLMPMLTDPRYIRVDGRPVVIVRRAARLPRASETVARWRREFAEQGHGELYLVAAQTAEMEDPRDHGFDAAVEIPTQRFRGEAITGQMRGLNPGFTGQVYDYRELADEFANAWPQDFVLHKTVSPGWDDTARTSGQGNSFVHSTPAAYASWLKRVLAGTAERYGQGQQLVFVNAWNAWADGAHLEPDRHYGYAWLNRTREALAPYAAVGEDDRALQAARPGATSAAIVHLYYPELFPEIASRLSAVADQMDLYFSVRPGTLAACQEMIHKVFPHAVVVSYANHGRDVVPFLRIYGHIQHFGYQAILKLHSKKSVHRTDGDRWRNEIYDALMGTPEIIAQHIARLAPSAAARVGMIGAAGHLLDGKSYWARNKVKASELALRFGCPAEWLDHFNFVAGTMYWFHPDALAPLMSLALTADQFEREQGQVDGTLAHVVERLMGLSCRKAGLILEDSKGHTDGSHTYDFAPRGPA